MTQARKRSGRPLPEGHFREEHGEAEIPIWKEALFGAEILMLYASPVYYGLGVPRGDGSAVIVIPGFLGSDLYLGHLHQWLDRIGYRSYLSGIGLNAECPNLLIQQRLEETLDKALWETERRVHLVGHSLGGIMARSVANRRPDDVASVITLAAPFRGTVAHRSVLHAADTVRKKILMEHGNGVLPQCYTARCTCDFVESLRCRMADSVLETAIYTRDDGIVDWHYCTTGKREVDIEVPGTHMGLVFNATAYRVIAHRLAEAQSPD